MSALLHNTKHSSIALFHTAHLPDAPIGETIGRMEKKRVKNNIRKLRVQLGLNQEKFGEPLNANRADISRYENGQHITVHLLMDLYRVYGFTPNDILLTERLEVQSGIDITIMKQSVNRVHAMATKMGVKLTNDEVTELAAMAYNLEVKRRSQGKETDLDEAVELVIQTHGLTRAG